MSTEVHTHIASNRPRLTETSTTKYSIGRCIGYSTVAQIDKLIQVDSRRVGYANRTSIWIAKKNQTPTILPVRIFVSLLIWGEANNRTHIAGRWVEWASCQQLHSSTEPYPIHKQKPIQYSKKVRRKPNAAGSTNEYGDVVRLNDILLLP